MKNTNVLRTAAVATLAAFVLATGVITSHEDLIEAPIAPVAAGGSPAFYFPADYELKPSADEPEVFEYY
jgi:hypothetical protein